MENLAAQLLAERENKYRGGIYYITQTEMAYNSNQIEGSRLSREHTVSLFSTRSIIPNEGEAIMADDIVETMNHFRAFDFMLDTIDKPLSENLIKKLHGILKAGTSDSGLPWFNVGDYKTMGNIVGTNETTSPERVPEEMGRLLEKYNSIETIVLDDILQFHVSFEKIHPFQDGNGRAGRLIMFRECLRAHITPFIIDERHKAYYYRGIALYGEEKGYLTDTCLSAQDRYAEYMKRYVPKT